MQEQFPDSAEIMRRVEQIAPALEQNAPRCDAARQIVPESIALLREAGLFRIIQPKSLKGFQLDLRTLSQATVRVSDVCPSSGWVFSLLAMHNFIVGTFRQRAQQDVFGQNADALVCSGFALQGQATAVEGGFRVKGRWNFSSGIDHSNWVIVGCADPKTGSALIYALVPRSEIQIVDAWYVIGMRGTGSKDVVVDDVFVPTYRTLTARELFSGDTPEAREHHCPLYLIPREAIAAALGASTVLGAAKGGVRRFTEVTRKRRSLFSGKGKAEYVPLQIRLAESASEVQCAQLLIDECLRQAEALIDNPSREVHLRAQLKWQSTYAIELCRRAMARLYASSGAHVIYDLHPFQAAFRNVEAAAQHSAWDFDVTAEQYGAITLGVLEDLSHA